MWWWSNISPSLTQPFCFIATLKRSCISSCSLPALVCIWDSIWWTAGFGFRWDEAKAEESLEPALDVGIQLSVWVQTFPRPDKTIRLWHLWAGPHKLLKKLSILSSSSQAFVPSFLSFCTHQWSNPGGSAPKPFSRSLCSQTYHHHQPK